jgi:hypothetical protein
MKQLLSTRTLDKLVSQRGILEIVPKQTTFEEKFCHGTFPNTYVPLQVFNFSHQKPKPKAEYKINYLSDKLDG